MARKVRINITVDRETLRLADRLARQQKVSRSTVLRDGVRALAENEVREAEDRARRARQRRAAEGMERLARKGGDWPAEEILRAFRYPWLSSSQRVWSRLRSAERERSSLLKK